MSLYDEKDYVMRMIQEMVRVLFSMLLGKQYTSVELPEENKYEVSGKSLEEFKEMVDQGLINEAENMLLENLDVANPTELAAAALFYQYVAEKDEDFLSEHHYSEEEALDGMKMLVERAGLGEMGEIFSEILCLV